MKKRVIFELDGTLLKGKMAITEDFFEKLYGEKSYSLKKMPEILKHYERRHDHFDYETLSSFISHESGLLIPSNIIREWDYNLGTAKYHVEDGAIELLQDLKKEGVSLAVLTNWFRTSQETKIKNHGLDSLIDGLYTGEEITKPHKSSYLAATGGFDLEDCVVVGNDLENDYIGPRALGMDSVLYDELDYTHSSIRKVTNLEELKRRL